MWHVKVSTGEEVCCRDSLAHKESRKGGGGRAAAEGKPLVNPTYTGEMTRISQTFESRLKKPSFRIVALTSVVQDLACISQSSPDDARLGDLGFTLPPPPRPTKRRLRRRPCQKGSCHDARPSDRQAPRSVALICRPLSIAETPPFRLALLLINSLPNQAGQTTKRLVNRRPTCYSWQAVARMIDMSLFRRTRKRCDWRHVIGAGRSSLGASIEL